MKLIALSLILSTSANARSLHPDTYARFAELTKWQVKHSFSPVSQVAGAQIKVNSLQKEIVLTVNLKSSCKPNRPCPRVAVPASRSIKLEMTDMVVDACGITTFTAEEDDRPVDGLYRKLTVISNAHNICMGSVFEPNKMTSVKYETRFWNRINRGETVTHSSFTGKLLDKKNKADKLLKRAEFLSWNGDLMTGVYSKLIGGNVAVNLKKNTLKLFLKYRSNCTTRICPMIYVVPERTIELKITNKQTNRCNVTTYVATKNDIPVDGILQSLKVVDNSKNTCSVLLMGLYVATSATYKTMHFDRMNGEEVSKKSSFTASQLK